ncbi:hypothetical protein FOYG_03664 [Fusarium oxysporum NRRL 32931]|uniref:Uncharacterized protein n=1 Tax=Fusarium oxysporum NRRL 32931 TaxID=660029 RepID=W9J271_FUSOX|nr:hypothetical protein FOYG_03664 [Fusarium oxysporum NRRL 32931]
MPADHLENAIAQLRAEVLSDPDATNDPVEAVDDQHPSYFCHLRSLFDEKDDYEMEDVDASTGHVFADYIMSPRHTLPRP